MTLPDPHLAPLPERPRARDTASCRQCPVSCERVVHPAGCLESGCPRVYSYERDGRTWFGCIEGVHRAEIDLDVFRMLQRTKLGFGGLRAVRDPLPVCRTEVERTFEHRAEGPCVRPDFLLSAPGLDYRVSVPQGPAGEAEG